MKKVRRLVLRQAQYKQLNLEWDLIILLSEVRIAVIFKLRKQ